MRRLVKCFVASALAAGLVVVSVAKAALPTVDLSADTSRQVVIAQGTPSLYQGHPTTLLMPNGKTMFCVWCVKHGGPCGPMKRSDNGGRTWSDLLPTPDNWPTVKNCPAIYRLVDPQGQARLYVFAGQGPDGMMHQSYSTDDGRTWTPMQSNGLKCVMPFCTIASTHGGNKLLALTNVRRPGETKDPRSNIIAQSESTDGGLTWSAFRIILDLGELKPCEPEIVRSPDGNQLLVLLRENAKREALYITSDDEGGTWSESKKLPPGLWGDRHKAVYTADGRLVVCFRDTGLQSETRNHFVAWVGRYDDIASGRDGQYRLKLLHSNAGGDCGYPGVELLPDGTIVATTYVKYRPGKEQNSVVSTRFTLAETDVLAKQSESAPVTTTAKSSPQDKPKEKSKAFKKPTGSREPVQLAKDASPADVDGKSYDLVIVGGASAGVACATRAAREGCTVLLVNHTRHLGGMMSNGLMQWDALYGGHRAPIFTEMLGRIEDYYRRNYGEDSRDFKVARYSQGHYPIGFAEPHVAEREFNRLIAGEKNITVLLAHYPTAVERDGAILKSVTLREFGGSKEIRVTGKMFADATYEGDLFALAKVPFRVGREARDEYNEPHAGKCFTNIAKGPAPKAAAEGKLNIRAYGSKQGTIDPTSPFTADGFVQAYNYRFCVTSDPENRILPGKPDNYNREEYVNYDRKYLGGGGPNSKGHMNSPILPGENRDYPEGDWPTREKIIKRHLDFALGLMYFLQNDESVPAAKRADYRKTGLPKDEFADNHHVPYEMYVREARRIVGRHVFTEHDGSLAKGFGRTPVHSDSVAVTDWYMDSHSCTTDKRPGYPHDGKLILTEESRPSQIPYRSLLPQGVDNLLVPTCMSATHVAWGAVRLEPVWMQTGEAAGYAAALAKKTGKTPAALDPELLIRTLIENRQLVSFFNDSNSADSESCTPALQYFGTRGFLHDYNARAAEPLQKATGKVWADGFARMRAGQLDPNAQARAVAEAEASILGPMTVAEFTAGVPQLEKSDSDRPITRGEALELLWKSP